jgi:hypothetical protein
MARQRRCVTASPQVVETGNRVADEQADGFNNGSKRSDFQKSVVEERADSLRLLMVRAPS